MTGAEMWAAAFPAGLWIVLGVCAVMSAVGFYKFVYFLSVGYGFAVTGAGIAIVCLYAKQMTLVSFALCAMFVIYGIRLGGFLLWRELKSASYRKTLQKATGDGKPMPLFVKIAIWVCVAVLYVMQVSPVLYRAANGDGGGVFPVIGLIVMIGALLLESTADKQKSKAKAQRPDRFCDSGLFKIVRCPNYLGEVLFWTGVLLSGIGALRGAVQWAVAALGYILIVYVMLSGAKRLELRQNKSYGSDPAYQAYVAKTPILFPLIPLYHLDKCDFIKA